VGIILADILRHAANCYWGEEMSEEKAQGVIQIVTAFNAEMSRPTAEPVMVTQHGHLAAQPIVAAGVDPEDVH
jgi:peptide methionine sulfoxide reductase MsrA